MYAAVNLSKILRAVCVLQRLDTNGPGSILGSGFFFMENDLVATSKHIMQHQACTVSDYVIAIVPSQSTELLKPVQCYYHTEQDIALLRLEKAAAADPLRPCTGTQAGFIYAAYSPTLSKIKMQHIPTFHTPEPWEGKHSTTFFFEWDSPIEPGNSGGPVVGTDGGVAGILTELGLAADSADADGNSVNVKQIRSRAVYIGPLLDLYARLKQDPNSIPTIEEPFR